MSDLDCLVAAVVVVALVAWFVLLVALMLYRLGPMPHWT